MVVLEVGIDARGAVTGSQQASSALNGLATAAAFAFNELGRTNSAMAALGSRITLFAAGASAVGAALGAVVTAITLMGQEAAKSSDSFDKLATSLNKLSARQQVGGGFGLPSFEAVAKERQIEALMEAAVSLRADEPGLLGFEQRRIPADDLIESFGKSGRFLGRDYIIRALEATNTSPLISYQGFFNRSDNLTTSQAIRVLQHRARQIRGPRPAQDAGLPGPFLGVAGEVGPVRSDGTFADPLPEQGPSREGFEAAQRQNRLEEMRELELLSLRVGDALGNAAFDFVSGLRDGRDVLASLLNELARGLTREAVGTLTRNIITSFGNS